MGSEIVAGVPASLTAIGLYTGIISLLGMACCSFVSVYERRFKMEEAEAAPPFKQVTPPTDQLRPIETGRLRDDFLSRN